ncbi:hypothetical protein [Arsukibacterium indicum]|uniref:Phage protein n=1 Tax=Arsukibacterium indicum TaxID=2848612 RepID=A0ABS6MHF0_9GAMM|nr:hypothetical protein [Arsukibacterium indicum]MBV2128200.1 hypothetical protein [Arsukibacterium indicum]
MKNKLSDLNNHLFAQLERLSDEKLSGEALSAEIHRSNAVTTVAKEIINNGRLVLDAQRQYDSGNLHMPSPMLEVQKK